MLEPSLGQYSPLKPVCVLPRDCRSDPKKKRFGSNVLDKRRDCPTSDSSREQNAALFTWRFGGCSRNDPIHFVFVRGAIPLTSMGLPPLHACGKDRYPLPSARAPSHSAKGREDPTTTTIAQGSRSPQKTPGYLPKSQPKCPPVAGVVSSLFFHHQASKTII